MYKNIVNIEDIKNKCQRYFGTKNSHDILRSKLIKWVYKNGTYYCIRYYGFELFYKIKLNLASEMEIKMFKKHGIMGFYYEVQLSLSQEQQIKETITWISLIRRHEELSNMSFEQMMTDTKHYLANRSKYRDLLIEKKDYEIILPEINIMSYSVESKAKLLKIISREAYSNEGIAHSNCLGDLIIPEPSSELFSLRDSKNASCYNFLIDKKTKVILESSGKENIQVPKDTMNTLTKMMNWNNSNSKEGKLLYRRKYLKRVFILYTLPSFFLLLAESLFYIITIDYYNLIYLSHIASMLVCSVFFIAFSISTPNHWLRQLGSQKMVIHLLISFSLFCFMIFSSTVLNRHLDKYYEMRASKKGHIFRYKIIK